MEYSTAVSLQNYIYDKRFVLRITKHDFNLKYSPRSSVGLERLTVISAVIRRSLVRLMVGRSDIFFLLLCGHLRVASSAT